MNTNYLKPCLPNSCSHKGCLLIEEYRFMFWCQNIKNNCNYLFNFCVPYKKTTQRVAGVNFGVFQHHHNVSVLFAVLCWPVLITFSLKHTRFAVNDTHTHLREKPFGFLFSVCELQKEEHTLPFSTRLVIMTMIPVFCSHTILQKSSKVDLRGPWAAI